MKKVCFAILLMAISIGSFSQQINPVPKLSKQDYLQKSKNKKTTAWILLGSGVTVIIVGAIVDDTQTTQTNQSFTGGFIEVGGIICGLISIPFFISSGKNKRKATSLSLNFQHLPPTVNDEFVSRSKPTVSIKLGL